MNYRISDISRENEGRKQSKSESLTLRLDSLLLEKLHQEANQKDITVNALVSQAIKYHVGWHATASKIGFISVRRSLITKLMEKCTDEDILSISRHMGKMSNKDVLMLLGGEYNIKSALDVFETWLKVSGFPYRHEVKNHTTHMYIIQHDMGKKWSLYLSQILQSGNLEGRKIDFEVDENTLSLKLDEDK